jgi:hypothetical protein
MTAWMSSSRSATAPSNDAERRMSRKPITAEHGHGVRVEPSEPGGDLLDLRHTEGDGADLAKQLRQGARPQGMEPSDIALEATVSDLRTLNHRSSLLAAASAVFPRTLILPRPGFPGINWQREGVRGHDSDSV